MTLVDDLFEKYAAEGVTKNIDGPTINKVPLFKTDKPNPYRIVTEQDITGKANPTLDEVRTALESDLGLPDVLHAGAPTKDAVVDTITTVKLRRTR